MRQRRRLRHSLIDSVRNIIDVYERHAHEYDRDRGRWLQEKSWLDRFLARVPVSGTVLDIGCGMAEPIARYIIESGFRVVGVDSSPTLIRLCRARFPAAGWIVGDMRELALARRFDGILMWDSFFHLSMDEQRAMLPRLAMHAREGAPLMFTSGPSEGEAIGTYHGEPLYHASLGPEEYMRLLASSGFTVRAFVGDDPACGNHSVWRATYAEQRGRS